MVIYIARLCLTLSLGERRYKHVLAQVKYAVVRCSISPLCFGEVMFFVAFDTPTMLTTVVLRDS